VGDEQVWYGLGDIAAVQGNSLPLGLFGVGLAMALRHKRTGETHEDAPGLVSFLRTHVIPARLYGLGYVVGALTTLHDAPFATAQMLWGLGYGAVPAAENRQFVDACKNFVYGSLENLGVNLLNRVSDTPEPNAIAIGSTPSEITAVILQVLPAADDFLNSQAFLDLVADRAISAYNDAENQHEQNVALDVLQNICFSSQKALAFVTALRPVAGSSTSGTSQPSSN